MFIFLSHYINIHIFHYPDTRLSGLFTEVPTSPDNRGSTVVVSNNYWIVYPVVVSNDYWIVYPVVVSNDYWIVYPVVDYLGVLEVKTPKDP